MSEKAYDAEEEAYRVWDDVLDCTSKEAAEAWVKKYMENLTVEETELVVRDFLGLTKKVLKKSFRSKPKSQKGGIGDTHDPRVYRLLELADTCHDFMDTKTEATKYISQYNYELPQDMTVHKLTTEKAFIEFMSTNRELIFGNDKVPNPCFGAKITTVFKITNAYADLKDIYKAQMKSLSGMLNNPTSKICSLDLYMAEYQNNKRMHVVRIHQVARLCATIRKWMGADCFFQVDSSDCHLALLVCAYKHLSNAFIQLFVIEPAFVQLRGLSQQLKNAIDAVDPMTKTTWKTETTDSNLFDASNNAVKLKFDARPTGNVFRERICGYQITLNGLVKKNQSVNATITDTGMPSVTLDITNKESTENFSKSVIKFAIGCSKPSKLTEIRHHLQNFSDPLKYALKRAGDWGQVEHCVRYNKVFVTSDKLASLYAYYRGVRFILLKRDDTHFTPALTTRVPFLRYSYILSR